MDRQTLLDKWMDAKGRNVRFDEFCASVSMDPKKVDNEIYKARLERRNQRPPDEAPPEFNVFELGSAWKLSGDWLITGDVHVPFTDWAFASRINDVAKRYLKYPRRLLVAGDFFNMDYFSTYVSIVQTPSWHDERAAARKLLISWLETFDEIRFIMGNHDRRMQKFLAGAFDESDLLALLTGKTSEAAQIDASKIAWSNWGWCTIETHTGTWRITHPKNYSINQLNVADTLAEKFEQHIISHHEHHFSIGWNRWKRYIIVNNGTLVDQQKLAYVMLDDSKSPNMAQGFVVLRDGHPYLFGQPPFTDWEKWI